MTNFLDQLIQNNTVLHQMCFFLLEMTTDGVYRTTEWLQEVTDDIGLSTTQQSVTVPTEETIYGCVDLEGQWSSKLTTERITLTHNTDDSLQGLYNACANCGWLGLEGRTATVESTLGMVVIGQGGEVISSWAG